MPPKLPTTCLLRPRLPPSSSTHTTTQIRHASLLRRPHRPYTFTQLIALSDGSTYTIRSTSPSPVFRSTKDTRNHPTWQPSLDSLRNVEMDEAGRLKAFRDKFGRGWDVEAEGEEEGDGDGMREGGLMDLISGGGMGEVKDGRAGKGVDLGQGKEVEMVTVRKDGVLVKVPKNKSGGK